GPPRFRRDPFERDWVFDHGRASAPRKTVPHMLPSTLLTGSASASFCLSRLNSQPHSIVVYASLPPLPTTPQHSLPGARYGLPGPVFHRLDRASLPGAQAIQDRGEHWIASSRRSSQRRKEAPMDDQERRASGMIQRRKILGDVWVDKSIAGRNAFNIDFQDLITRYAWNE